MSDSSLEQISNLFSKPSSFNGINQNFVPKHEKNSNIDLIWLDVNVDNIENKKYQPQLEKFFEKCHFIKTIQQSRIIMKEEKKYFVIVSGSLG